VPPLSLGDWIVRVGRNLSRCAGFFVPFSPSPSLALGVTAAVMLALFVTGGARTRYFLVWAALAAFPYAASEGYAPRFGYFVALPLAAGLALGASDLGRRAGRVAGAAASTALCGFAVASALSFPRELELYAGFSNGCTRILEDCRAQDVTRFDGLCVD